MYKETAPYQRDQKEIPSRQTPHRGGSDKADKSKRYPNEDSRKLNV